MRLGLQRTAAAAALLMLALPAAGQTYPDKVVKIVVGSAPGAGLDLLMRGVAQELGERWGKPVIVDNRPGASGLISAEAVTGSPADGYTLLAVTDQIYLSNRFAFKRLPYDPDSLANISIIAKADQFVLADAKVPARTVGELVELDKKKPGSLAYGSWGDGSQPQMIYETLNRRAGTSFLGVPYKGVAPVLNALSANEVQLSVISSGTAAPLWKAGKLRPLAIAAKARSSEFPDIPTTTEEGYPELQAFIWFGLAAPAGTPSAIVERLSADVQSIARKPEFAERYVKSLGWNVVASTSAEMDATIRTELPIIQQMMTNAGVKPQ